MGAVDLVVALGVLVSLGLVGVSAVLNFRMGYRSADTEFDAMVYGLGAGFGDTLKAMAPFMGFYGLRHRDWIALLAAVMVFTVATSYSFTAALGFAAQHRAAKEATALGDIEHHGDARKEFERITARLDQVGLQRTPEEVDRDIATLLKKPYGKRTVADISANCTLNRVTTRQDCTKIAVLQQEDARAREVERLALKAEDLRKEMKTATGVQASADPQVDALKRASELVTNKVDKADIGFFLSFLLAAFIEIGSGLGLYVVTTPWRAREKKTVLPEPASSTALTTRAANKADVEPAIGVVEIYAVDRLEPEEGAEVHVAEMFMDYLIWCQKKRVAALSRTEFARRFASIANEAGIRHIRRNRMDVYQDVKLMCR